MTETHPERITESGLLSLCEYRWVVSAVYEPASGHLRVLTLICQRGHTHVYRLWDMVEVVYNLQGEIVEVCKG